MIELALDTWISPSAIVGVTPIGPGRCAVLLRSGHTIPVDLPAGEVVAKRNAYFEETGMIDL